MITFRALSTFIGVATQTSFGMFNQLPDRIQALIQTPSSDADCWTWIGALNGTKTPVAWDGSNTVSARPLIRGLLGVSIPEGYRAKPANCKNKLCVNPNHRDVVPLKPKRTPGLCKSFAVVADDLMRKRFFKKVTPKDPESCWLWEGAQTATGYGFMWWKRDGERRIFPAHRISYALANGEAPAGMAICHRCDTPLCVNPNHLFAGTTTDNRIDCISKGRDKIHLSKLTQKRVDEIRAIFAANPKASKREVAERYGVVRQNIYKLLSGHHWKTRRPV